MLYKNSLCKNDKVEIEPGDPYWKKTLVLKPKPKLDNESIEYVMNCMKIFKACRYNIL